MVRLPLILALILAAPLVAGDVLKAEVTADNRLRISRAAGGDPILVQNAVADKRPYIHPLLAPDGKGILTEDSPGHHKWQHGIYVGMDKVNGQDFWHKEENVFHPKPLAPAKVVGNTATWTVETVWSTEQQAPVLTEQQAWTLTDRGTSYQLDLTWTLTAEVDITFGKYQYGGLFIRMPFKGKGEAQGSEGGKPKDQARARWTSVWMPIEGRDDGASLLYCDHPSNAEYPQPWRFDGQFGFAPSRCILGDRALAKGRAEVQRYRLVVQGGKLAADACETMQKEFAK